MEWMTRADVLLLAIAAYVAVMTLVRMMQRRRDQVVADVQRQVEAHRKRAKRSSNDQTRGAA
jgi:hypothetical protein